MNRIVALATAALLSTAVQAGDPQAIYQKACTNCHAAGVAGAPKTHDAEAWAPRLAKGMDALLASVKNGMGAMPPGALCGDCTDDDYKAVIEFMSK